MYNRPMGKDTLLVGDYREGLSEDVKSVKNTFPGAYGYQQLGKKQEGDISSFYALTRGNTHPCYIPLFENATIKFAVAQEFGTFPIAVLGFINSLGKVVNTFKTSLG
eukprot:m.276171 g.276171  ORF g.276171 m.276171 type:complete len:107 (-) comp16298_c0_seq18:1081-1401(-)